MKPIQNFCTKHYWRWSLLNIEMVLFRLINDTVLFSHDFNGNTNTVCHYKLNHHLLPRWSSCILFHYKSDSILQSFFFVNTKMDCLFWNCVEKKQYSFQFVRSTKLCAQTRKNGKPCFRSSLFQFKITSNNFTVSTFDYIFFLMQTKRVRKKWWNRTQFTWIIFPTIC